MYMIGYCGNLAATIATITLLFILWKGEHYSISFSFYTLNTNQGCVVSSACVLFIYMCVLIVIVYVCMYAYETRYSISPENYFLER